MCGGRYKRFHLAVSALKAEVPQQLGGEEDEPGPKGGEAHHDDQAERTDVARGDTPPKDAAMVVKTIDATVADRAMVHFRT